jgi:hypothetical protein
LQVTHPVLVLGAYALFILTFPPVASLAAAVVLSLYDPAEAIVTFHATATNWPLLGAVLPPPKLSSADPNVQALVSQADYLHGLIGQNFGNTTDVSVAIESVYESKPLT